MSIVLVGSTSGSVTLQEPAVAGTTVIDLPATSGTMAVTGGSPSFATMTVTGNANFATSSGNVGIGTSSPNQKLVVAGNIGSASASGTDSYLNVSTNGVQNTYLGFNNSGSTNSNGVLNNYSYVGNGNAYGLQFLTNGSVKATIDTSGNVGIGTSSPDGKLKVVASGANLIIGFSGTQNYFDASENIFRNFAGTERMRIDSSGRVCIGVASAFDNAALTLQRTNTTTNPIVQNILNTASTSTARGTSALLRVSSNASNADVNIQFTDNVSNNYYFGGNNGGAYVFANSGGVRLSSGGTSWASDSDERIKDIIEPITNAVNKVSQLRAVIGKYKTDEESTRRSFLIAQDVQKVLPEAVVAQPDEIGTLTLAYTETIPLLVAAIQEQQAIITDLKARIETLENK